MFYMKVLAEARMFMFFYCCSGAYPSSSARPSATPMQSLGFPTPAGATLRHHVEHTSDSQGTLRGLSTLETQLDSAKSSGEAKAAG